MRQRLLKIIILLCLPTATVLAQNTTKDTPKTQEVCSSAVDASGLTGCEKAVLENFNLKQWAIQQQSQTLQQQAKDLGDQYNKTIALLKANHPGMVYNPPSPEHPYGNFSAPTPVKK